MALFIEAALLNMDNRLKSIQPQKNIKILSLDYFEWYSLPTTKTIRGVLLERLKINHQLETNSESWSIPVTREELAFHNPQVLILNTMHPSLREQILADPSLSTVDAVKLKKIYSVDYALQDSPHNIWF